MSFLMRIGCEVAIKLVLIPLIVIMVVETVIGAIGDFNAGMAIQVGSVLSQIMDFVCSL